MLPPMSMLVGGTSSQANGETDVQTTEDRWPQSSTVLRAIFVTMLLKAFAAIHGSPNTRFEWDHCVSAAIGTHCRKHWSRFAVPW